MTQPKINGHTTCEETYSENERFGTRPGFAHDVAYGLTIGHFNPNIQQTRRSQQRRHSR